MTDIILRISLSHAIVAGDRIVINVGDGNIQDADGGTGAAVGAETVAGHSFLGFMETLVGERLRAGKHRMAEIYSSALNSFRRFRSGADIDLSAVNRSVVDDYVEWLRRRGLADNTVSFYIRVTRSIYNRAVDRRLTVDRQPFRGVRLATRKTRKRALTPETLALIHSYRPATDTERFALDMFFLSFCLRGMAFVDLAYLRLSSLTGDTIVYTRRKTGQRLTVRRTPQVDRLLRRNAPANDVYALPVIRAAGSGERMQLRACQARVNRTLNSIGRKLSMPGLTMYMARHSWASIARMADVPLETICKCMGHDSEKTTRIYIKNFDTDSLHEANARVMAAVGLKF